MKEITSIDKEGVKAVNAELVFEWLEFNGRREEDRDLSWEDYLVLVERES